MQSPKFPLKKKDIEEVINPSRLKSVWKHKVREAMRRQIVSDPIENLDFHTQLDAMCAAIHAEVTTGAYIPRPATRLLSEKSKGLCRQIVIPTVKDALILQTLSDALWVELAKKAPSKNAFYAPEDLSFAKTIKGHTSEYGSIKQWLMFQEEIFGFARKRKFVVVTDIANFYDFISYDHLRNILADLSIAREHALDLLIYTLSHMLWQPDYMPRVQVGLPQMALDAPRMLAHCFLFEVDALLNVNKNIDFTRFMDDIDVGTDTIAQAKIILRDLDLTLQTRQIRLNSGKTKIMTEIEAARHFKIRENRFLDAFEKRFDAKIAVGTATIREQRFLCDAISWGVRNGQFAIGNGEKILKRCINYARTLRGDIKSNDLIAIIRDWPGARSTALLWWSHHKSPDEQLPIIASLLTDGTIIDDFGQLEIINAFVRTRLSNSTQTLQVLSDVSNSLDRKTLWGFYSKAWLLSKYGSCQDILTLVESSVSTWVTYEILSRLIGGLYPRLIGSPFQTKFDNIINRYGSRWAQDVYAFHKRLATTVDGYTSVRKFIIAKNPSQPNFLTHAKFLMLLTLLHNKSIQSNAVLQLRGQHAYALTDQFYSKTIPPFR